MSKFTSYVLCAAAVGFAAHAETWTTNNVTYTYTVSNGKAEIYNEGSVAISPEPTGDLTIPSALGGYPVTGIGAGAFSDCNNLTSVTIPDSVTSIGAEAFSYCVGLWSVTIPDSVTSIGAEAFYDCGLTGVTIPNSVTSIGKAAFSLCCNITSVTIPNSVTSIADSAFEGCLRLTSVTIPNSITSIGENAFANCSGLRSVTIPGSVTGIGDWAFWRCEHLTNVTMRGDAPSVGYAAFKEVNSTAVVHLPEGASEYEVDEDGKWQGMTVEWYGPEFTIDANGVLTGVNLNGVEKVVIPAGVTGIGDRAFWNCTKLTSVTIPDSVTSIRYGAFSSCVELTSVTIPGSVTRIDNYAFAYSGLTSVTIGNGVTSIGQNAFGNCISLTNVTILDSVTSIESYAFGNCTNLTSVTIGKGMTNIASHAFAHCSSLTNVTMRGDAPNALGAFSGVSEVSGDAVVHLPRGASGYEVDENGKWKGMTVEWYDLEPEITVNGAAAGVLARQSGAVGIVTYDPLPFTETQTTPVPVPYAWLNAHVPGVALEVEAYEASAKATAANGRKTWECYALGIEDLSDPLDDFCITNFWMDGNMPMFEFNHTTDGNGNSFLPYVKALGKAKLTDAWRHVPEGGNPAFRFFAVEVVPPGCESIVVELGGVQLWENGPYWAECNVGATSPEEYGYYFWWGDTVGYTRTGGTLTSNFLHPEYYTGVTWVSSTGEQMSSSPFDHKSCPTYEKENAELLSEGWIDSTTNLVAAHDAATAHLGAPWRMPTSAEIEALVSNCTSEWITTNGVNGRLVTGKGDYADRSIFLPAASYGSGSSFYDPGSQGDFWASTPISDFSNNAGDLFFSTNYFQGRDNSRYIGQPVRPVRDAQ